MGVELSSVHAIENGMPEGARFSPILFLCMVSDFSEGFDHIQASQFVNDSAIYKLGRNMGHLQKVVQRNFNKFRHSVIYGDSKYHPRKQLHSRSMLSPNARNP